MTVNVYMRRTGVAFLSLVLATNCLPWMELVTGRSITSEVVSAPSEYGVPAATCFLAALLVIGAWLSGRRLPVPLNPRIPRPRDAGLVLAVVCAAINIALAGTLRWLGSRHALSLGTEIWLFAVVWYLVVLPTQVVAGFCKGRASIPVLKPAAASA